MVSEQLSNLWNSARAKHFPRLILHSVTLAEWCLERNITIVGTLKSDRKGIPKEMKGVADREEKSIAFCYSEDEKTMLLSYIDKKKKGKENILALTTMHKQVKLSVDERKKPHALVFYNHTKGGVDVIAKMLTRMKTRRWTLNVFVFMLDTARANQKPSSRKTLQQSHSVPSSSTGN